MKTTLIKKITLFTIINITLSFLYLIFLIPSVSAGSFPAWDTGCQGSDFSAERCSASAGGYHCRSVNVIYQDCYHRHWCWDWGVPYCCGASAGEHSAGVNIWALTCTPSQRCVEDAGGTRCADACQAAGSPECKTYSNDYYCNANKAAGTACSLGTCTNGVCCSTGTAAGVAPPNGCCTTASYVGPTDNKCYDSVASYSAATGLDYVADIGICGQPAVINPGFENNRDWDITSFGGGRLQINSAFSHSGKRALQSTVPAGEGPSALSSIITLIPNEEYTISGWIFKSEKGDARLSVLNTDANQYIGCVVSATQNGVWEHVSCSFNSLGNSQGRILANSGSFNGTSTIYFDDIHLIGPGLTDGKIAADTLGNSYVCTHDGSQWKWHNAQLKAFEITPTGSYDTISNGNEWFVCNATNIGNVPSANTFDATSLEGFQPTYAGDTSGVTGEELPPGPQLTPQQPAENLEDVVDKDEFFSGFSEIVLPSPGNVVTQPIGTKTFSVNVAQKEITYGQKLNLKITAPPPFSFSIRNITGLEIKVSEGDQLLPTMHEEIASNTLGTIDFFNVTLPPGLSLGSHNLNITIMSSPTTIYGTSLFQNVFTKIAEDIKPAYNALQVNPQRFLCVAETKQTTQSSAILECCGPLNDYCVNQNRYDVTRTSGGPTGLLKDYYDILRKNVVYRTGFAPLPIATVVHRYTVSDLPITKWDRYDTLEFDILLVGSTKLNLSINASDGTIIFNDAVLKYSTTGAELRKWHHIRIPLTSELKTKDIKWLRFLVPQIELLAEVGSKRVLFAKPGETLKQYYLMAVGLDRIFLSSPATKYCATDFSDYLVPIGLGLTQLTGASNVGKWVDDLDQERDACNNVASYHWTGTQCCGDDQGAIIGLYNPQYPSGIESYNDIEAGCWQGQFVANNTITKTIISVS